MGGLGPALGLATSIFGMFQGQKEQKSDINKAKPKSAEELEKEARAEAEKKRRLRAKGKANYGKTNYAGATGIAGQQGGMGDGLKNKVGE